MRWLVLALLLYGCGVSSLIPSLGGSGTNVAANTQIGKENNQGINTNVDKSVRPVLRPEGPVETVQQDNSTTNISEINPLMLILLILGWLAPSPNEIARGIKSLFTRTKRVL